MGLFPGPSSLRETPVTRAEVWPSTELDAVLSSIKFFSATSAAEPFLSWKPNLKRKTCPNKPCWDDYLGCGSTHLPLDTGLRGDWWWQGGKTSILSSCFYLWDSGARGHHHREKRMQELLHCRLGGGWERVLAWLSCRLVTLGISCRGNNSAHFSLPDSTGSVNGVDMLKVHCSHPHLIVQLKFCKRENCRRFLRSYREGALQESLQNHLQLSLAMSTVPLEMELKTGSEQLDSMLKDEDRCLDCIYREKVSG